MSAPTRQSRVGRVLPAILLALAPALSLAEDGGAAEGAGGG